MYCKYINIYMIMHFLNSKPSKWSVNKFRFGSLWTTVWSINMIIQWWIALLNISVENIHKYVICTKCCLLNMKPIILKTFTFFLKLLVNVHWVFLRCDYRVLFFVCLFLFVLINKGTLIFQVSSVTRELGGTVVWLDTEDTKERKVKTTSLHLYSQLINPIMFKRKWK